MKNLGQVISSLRKKRNLSQGSLANQIGISQTYMSMIERDKKEPSITVVKQIGESLEVPYQLLFFLTLDEKDLSTTNEFKQPLLVELKSFISSELLND